MKRFDFKPEEPDQTPATISELKAWMLANGCNFLSYQIDSTPIAEGFILEEVGDTFHWSYTERGKKRVVESFDKESDAVAHAFQQIRGDGWAWSRMVGFLDSQADLQELKDALNSRRIRFYDDVIPYGGIDDPRYRVYVHGRDAPTVRDLYEKYGKPTKPAPPKAKFFGFWLPVNDEQSARDAIKMSGLPVLVMGGNAGLFALLSENSVVSVVSTGIAVMLVVSAFRIRGGRASFVPVMAALFGAFFLLICVFHLLAALTAVVARPLFGSGGLFLAFVLGSLIVPFFCAALAFSGWRGWRWLRKNNLPRGF